VGHHNNERDSIVGAPPGTSLGACSIVCSRRPRHVARRNFAAPTHECLLAFQEQRADVRPTRERANGCTRAASRSANEGPVLPMQRPVAFAFTTISHRGHRLWSAISRIGVSRRTRIGRPLMPPCPRATARATAFGTCCAANSANRSQFFQGKPPRRFGLRRSAMGVTDWSHVVPRRPPLPAIHAVNRSNRKRNGTWGDLERRCVLSCSGIIGLRQAQAGCRAPKGGTHAHHRRAKARA
jgi:hypothetical protein